MQVIAAALAGTDLPAPVTSAAVIEAPVRRALTGRARTPKSSRRAPVAAGSLEDRILSAADAPVTLKHLVEAGGARPADVKKAVKALLASGQLERTGKTTKTRYQAR